jgi:hypothetical protein
MVGCARNGASPIRREAGGTGEGTGTAFGAVRGRAAPAARAWDARPRVASPSGPDASSFVRPRFARSGALGHAHPLGFVARCESRLDKGYLSSITRNVYRRTVLATAVWASVDRPDAPGIDYLSATFVPFRLLQAPFSSARNPSSTAHFWKRPGALRERPHRRTLVRSWRAGQNQRAAPMPSRKVRGASGRSKNPGERPGECRERSSTADNP